MSRLLSQARRRTKLSQPYVDIWLSATRDMRKFLWECYQASVQCYVCSGSAIAIQSFETYRLRQALLCCSHLFRRAPNASGVRRELEVGLALRRTCQVTSCRGFAQVQILAQLYAKVDRFSVGTAVVLLTHSRRKSYLRSVSDLPDLVVVRRQMNTSASTSDNVVVGAQASHIPTSLDQQAAFNIRLRHPF